MRSPLPRLPVVLSLLVVSLSWLGIVSSLAIANAQADVVPSAHLASRVVEESNAIRAVVIDESDLPQNLTSRGSCSAASGKTCSLEERARHHRHHSNKHKHRFAKHRKPQIHHAKKFNPGKDIVAGFSGGTGGNSHFFHGKLGFAWGMGSPKNIEDFITPQTGWIYNWEATPHGTIPDGLRYCSMLWGDRNVDDYVENVLKKPNEGANGSGKCTLAMNEVNLGSQAGMTPQHACGLMRRYQVPLKEHNFKIGAPATTYGPTGFEWMRQFKQTCPDVWEAIDFSTIHFYEVKFEWFRDFIEKWHKEFKKDILITEIAAHSFGGSGQLDQAGVAHFMKQAVAYAMKTDHILGVAWAGIDHGRQGVNKMVTPSGEPNQLYQAWTATAQSMAQQIAGTIGNAVSDGFQGAMDGMSGSTTTNSNDGSSDNQPDSTTNGDQEQPIPTSNGGGQDGGYDIASTFGKSVADAITQWLGISH